MVELFPSLLLSVRQTQKQKRECVVKQEDYTEQKTSVSCRHVRRIMYLSLIDGPTFKCVTAILHFLNSISRSVTNSIAISHSNVGEFHRNYIHVPITTVSDFFPPLTNNLHIAPAPSV